MQITSPVFGPEEIAKVQECLASGWVTQGPFVSEFEKLFAARHQVPHAFACTSCTTALHLATWALQLGPGDEVIVPAFTWITSANCVEFVGAKTVFVEVEPETFNIDPAALEAAITPKTKAIVAVHLFGLAAKMDELTAIARKHKLAIIEDAACAVGATYKGRAVGSHGNLTCFSFHPRKVITTGEGGMITTGDAKQAKRIAAQRNHGSTGLPAGVTKPGPYTMGTFNLLGNNYRLSDIQAAVGVVQMGRLDALLAERKACAEKYFSLLAGIADIALPSIPEHCGHSFQSFVIRVLEGGSKRRNRIMDSFAEADIQTRPGTHAVHRLGYYADKYGLKAEDFPIAAACEDTTITLPIFHGMTDADQERVAARLRSALAE
ncbi:DegT/DnrJ/EryC1/StrS family aminotransferase [Desulfovibrio sp. OttesenSCG-928-G11]|nr:DegT/DnrJ/EryC1/StrS family aminotransferase [Desulfovibrio sp. OttesenSCG-928-G11]